MTPVRFLDRADAGRLLSAHLMGFAGRPGLLVLALPRGGVPVAAEVARALRAPFDVFLVRKLGVPGHEELAMGAIAEGGITVLDERLIRTQKIDQSVVDRAAAGERFELDRRERHYRGSRPRPSVADRIVIVVDDGLATGATMEAAVVALRALKPTAIVVAVPVGAQQACDRLARLADEVVCPLSPRGFGAVGEWYDDFSQTSDEEVRRLIAGARL